MQIKHSLSIQKMIKKLFRFFKYSRQEQRKRMLIKIKMLFAIPFYFGKANSPSTIIAYQPDSYAHFSNHKEFDNLFKCFISENKLNNAGDVPRLWSLILNIKKILEENIQGDFAELGVWRGNTASILAYYAFIADRNVYLFDTFEGFNASDLQGVDNEKAVEFSDTSLATVKKIIGPLNVTKCHFVKGHFPSSITKEHRNKKYSIVSIDCDLYAPMKAGLEFFYPLMPKGGLLLLHDYSSMFWKGAKKAIDEFCQNNNEHVILMPDKSGSAFIRISK